MKRYFFWLKTEYKRAVRALPSFFVGWLIVVLLLGLIGGIGYGLLRSDETGSPVTIGYIAEKDEMMDMGLQYIDGLASLQSVCTLVEIDEEATGVAMLSEKKLDGLIVMPSGMVQGILDGTNEPARIYLPKESPLLGTIFEEMVTELIGTLDMSQAEVYAAYDLLTVYGTENGQIRQIWDDLNGFNLDLVMNRESLFRKRTLTLTGGTGIFVYFGAAFLTVALFGCGILAAGYGKRDRHEKETLRSMGGIPLGAQIAGRIVVAASFPLLSCGLILGIALAVWPKVLFLQKLGSVRITAAGVAVLLLASLLAAAWQVFWWEFGSSRVGAFFLQLITTFLCGAACGCFLPETLLPASLNRVAVWLPLRPVRNALTVFFTGKAEGIWPAVAGMAAWTVCLFALELLTESIVMRRVSGSRKDGKAVSGKARRLFFAPVPIIALKRLFGDKNYRILLVVLMVGGLAVMLTTRDSSTEISAVFYTEDEELADSLSDYRGMIRFTRMDSVDAVQRAVTSGRAQCGYELTEDLQNLILKGKADWAISVWERDDATMTNAVNEVLFARIFDSVSQKYYAGLLAKNDENYDFSTIYGNDEPENTILGMLDVELKEGNLFRIEIVRDGVEVADEPYDETDTDTGISDLLRRITLGVWCALGVTAAFFMGLYTVNRDRRNRGMEPAKHGVIVAATLIWPVLFATGVCILLCFIYGRLFV